MRRPPERRRPRNWRISEPLTKARKESSGTSSERPDEHTLGVSLPALATSKHGWNAIWSVSRGRTRSRQRLSTYLVSRKTTEVNPKHVVTSDQSAEFTFTDTNINTCRYIQSNATVKDLDDKVEFDLLWQEC